MRYLFYDIECCNGRDMCEFGYVLTDEKFNVLEKNVFLINPKEKFNLTGRKRQKDIKLFFTEEQYYNSPEFPYYHKRIKELLEYKDQIVIGYAIEHDVYYLIDACRRYKLKFYNFNFLDCQKVYSIYSDNREHISLEKSGEVLHVDSPKFMHRSDEDAYQTMLVIKAILENLDMTMQDLQYICLEATGKSQKGLCLSYKIPMSKLMYYLSKDDKRLSNRQKLDCLEYFLDNVKPSSDIKINQLTNKKLCFSKKFEKYNTVESYKLIQLLVNSGCLYNKKMSENDYFVISNEEKENYDNINNERFKIVKELLSEEDCHIKIITLDELYEILGISHEELEKMPFPKVAMKRESLYGVAGKKERKNKDHIEVMVGGASILEMIKAKQAKGR